MITGLVDTVVTTLLITHVTLRCCYRSLTLRWVFTFRVICYYFLRARRRTPRAFCLDASRWLGHTTCLGSFCLDFAPCCSRSTHRFYLPRTRHRAPAVRVTTHCTSTPLHAHYTFAYVYTPRSLPFTARLRTPYRDFTARLPPPLRSVLVLYWVHTLTRYLLDSTAYTTPPAPAARHPLDALLHLLRLCHLTHSRCTAATPAPLPLPLSLPCTDFIILTFTIHIGYCTYTPAMTVTTVHYDFVDYS